MHQYLALLLLLIATLVGGTVGFAAPRARSVARGAADRAVAAAPGLTFFATPSSHPLPASVTALHAGADDGAADPSEVVARRIVVVGDVDGGYYRSCVKNEASRFRKLIGTMSPPDDTKKAEIYVEGKRKMIDGFVRWCQKGDVGLSQAIKVESVTDEEPTGLFEDFYVQTGRS